MKYWNLTTAPYTPHPETDERGRLLIKDTPVRFERKGTPQVDKAFKKSRLKANMKLFFWIFFVISYLFAWCVALSVARGWARILTAIFLLALGGAVFLIVKRRLSLPPEPPTAEELEAERQRRKYYIELDSRRCKAAVAPFRDYYGYTEENVVTKCFVSSDKKFSGKDVCLFWGKDGTLRLAADLKHGFLRANFDLGCYVFEKDEYECISAAKSEYNIEDEGRETRCLLLKAENVRFLLGRRAFAFLKKGGTGLLPNAQKPTDF